MLIGTRVQATLWRVEYRRLCERHDDAPADEQHFTGGTVMILSADPSGADVHEIAREAVLGKGTPARDFSLISVARLADTVKGFAQVEEARS